VFVVVGSPEGSVILEDLDWEQDVASFDLVLSQKEIARWIEEETKHGTTDACNSSKSDKSNV